MNGQDRILITDDEPQMCTIIEYIFSKAGYDTRTAPDAETAWTLIRREPFDCAILDVMLPRSSGLTLCQRIQEHSRLPVIFLSALGSAEERVAGFEAGADDYIVKPFNARELLLRTRAVLSRYRSGAVQDVIENGPMHLYPQSHTLVIGNRRIQLSEHETRLLAALARRLNEPVMWRELVATVWLTDAPQTGKEMLKTLIHRLRTKLGPGAPDLIHAVRGSGYLMPTLTVMRSEAGCLSEEILTSSG